MDDALEDFNISQEFACDFYYDSQKVILTQWYNDTIRPFSLIWESSLNEKQNVFKIKTNVVFNIILLGLTEKRQLCCNVHNSFFFFLFFFLKAFSWQPAWITPHWVTVCGPYHLRLFEIERVSVGSLFNSDMAFRTPLFWEERPIQSVPGEQIESGWQLIAVRHVY